MNRQKKAAGASSGTGRDTANDVQSFKRYCTPNNIPLSTLLDQALHRYEHCRDLAQIYAAEAEKHHAILASLQSLIPPGKRGRGGVA